MVMKTLKRTCFGFISGMAVGNLIAALSGSPSIVSPALLERAGSLSAALLWQTLLSGVIGGASFAGVSLYEIERWPLLLSDAAHYICYMIVFIPVSFFLGWTETPGEAAVMALILLAVHTIIFLIMCARYRAEVRELNALNERRNAQNHQQVGGAL